MRILVADKLAPEGPEFLSAQHGTEVLVKTGLGDDELIRILKDCDGVVVRSATKITGPVIEGALAGGGRLRGVARAGVGVDNIDLEAATRHGIAVLNSASASTITTAEHAFALMISLARNVGPAYRSMTEGKWDRSAYVGSQLHGKTLGVVGLGRIGRTLAERALAFGMNVIAFDPLVNTQTALDGQVRMYESFEELISQVDVVSFHVPKTDVTVGMLGAPQFAIARPGLLVVNAARGGIVDESALLDAVESGLCAGAALDVFSSEPPPADSPLTKHPKILTTPHLGASTSEAQEAVSVDACKALLTYLRGEGLHGAVNAGGLRLDLSDEQKRFVDLAQRMVTLLSAAVRTPRISHVQFTMRGETIASRADTIARYALAELLQRNLDEPINIISAPAICELRGIASNTNIAGDQSDDRLSIEVTSEPGQPPHVVEGAIYADGQPRITHLDGYTMDMIPAGHMVILTNADLPGRIGLVGQIFGEANVNIAEMVIGRKLSDTPRGSVAMMVLKVDDPPTEALIESLKSADGILSVGVVELPAT